MRNLEDICLKAEVSLVVLQGQSPARFVVEISGKKEIEPPIVEAKDNRVTVNCVGCRGPAEAHHPCV